MKLSNIASIFLYLICFILCLLLARAYQHKLEQLIREEENKSGINIFWKRIAIATIISLPLLLLAAVRGDIVGVDTQEYSRYFYTYCRQFPDFASYYKYRKEDVLYSLISVLVYKYTKSVIPLFFIMEFFTVVPIILVGTKKVKDIPLWKIVSVYCFWFFNDSLNANRQYAAVGLLFLAYDLFFSNKKLRSLIPFLMAAGIHFSALLFGPLLLGINYMMKSKHIKIWKQLVPILAIAFLIFGRYGFQWLHSAGVLPYRYILYINTFINGRGSDASITWSVINIRTIIFCLIRILITFLLYFITSQKKKNKFVEINHYNYKYIYLLNTIMYVGGVIILHTSYVIRITIFLDFFTVIILPYLDNYSRLKTGKNKAFYSLWFSIIYWFIHTVFLGESASIPYEFRVEQ